MTTKTAKITEVSPEPMGVVAVVQQRLVRLGVWLRNLRNWKTARANRDLRRAMKRDPYFAHVWQCNIAMPILDGADGKLTHKEANEIADRLMRHLFDVKTNTERDDSE
jgi:hypothetical protein